MIVAGLAALPSRFENIPKVLEHILPHVHRVVIAVDAAVSDTLRPPQLYRTEIYYAGLGDAGKFLGVGPGDRYLTLDDDIIYPETYVEDMLAALDTYGGVVTLGGRNVPSKITNYYRETPRISCLSKVIAPTRVHIPLSGCAAFDTSVVGIRPEDCKRDAADIWLGRYCAERGIPCTAIPHPADYLKLLPDPGSIFERCLDNDAAQVAAVNEIDWPAL